MCQGPQLVLLSPPRPWFGRPTRPTTARPRVLKEGRLDMQAHAEVMQERVDRMRRVCRWVEEMLAPLAKLPRKQGDNISSPKRVGSAHTLMWDTAHHLVYCPIYKVGSPHLPITFPTSNYFPRWRVEHGQPTSFALPPSTRTCPSGSGLQSSEEQGWNYYLSCYFDHLQ